MKLPRFPATVAVAYALGILAACDWACGAAPRSISLVYDLDDVQVADLEANEQYARVTARGCASLHRLGEPCLPFRTARILLPPGLKLDRVRAELLAPVRSVSLRAPVEFGRTPIPFGEGRLRALALAAKDRPDARIYGSSKAYPSDRAQLISVQRLCGHDIALVRLYPVQYLPAKKRLIFCGRLSVELQLSPSSAVAASQALLRGRRNVAARVAALVDNPGVIAEYPAPVPAGGSASQSDGPVTLSTYDYLLITNRALLSSFQPLIDQKLADGLKVQTATVEDIYEKYPSGKDDPEKIRNYISYAYTTWGVKYVLLGGDTSVVPCRGAYAYSSSVGALTNLPTDLYYACLEGSWNSDNDTVWGEPTDGEGGKDVDLLAEVYVGRAPVETNAEVTTFVSKVVAYEQKGTPNADAALLLGEYLADASYEGQRNQGGLALQVEVLPHLSNYTVTWLDDRPEHYSVWTKANCIAELNKSPHIVAHVGHGGITWVLRLDRALGSADVAGLTNASPFLLHSTACHVGAFDSEDSLGESFVKLNAQGAFAAVLNTRYGFYDQDFTWYYSGEFQGKFFDRLITQGYRNLGAAFELSREDMVGEVETKGSMTYRWCYFTTTLLGDPHTPFQAAASRTLTVKSFDSTPSVNGYVTGVTIGVSPSPDGVTEFSRSYADGATATLTAPETHEALRFQRWRLDGTDQATGQRSLTVAMSADRTAVAVYTDPPILSLLETAESKFVRPGETVTVKLNVSDLAGREINSIQTLMQFDNTRLSNASITKSSLPPWNGGFEPLKTISGDQIDYTIGILGSTIADAEVAVLTFTAGATEGTAYVRFRPDEPPKYTKVVGPSLAEYLPDRLDAGPIIIDGTPPAVALKSPVGGEYVRGGGSWAITWATTDANPDTVKIEYSTNGAAGPWTTIASGIADAGSYTWNPVASVDSATCRIRVAATDKVGLTGSDTSESNFTIDSTAPVVVLSSPNGGEYLRGGGSWAITWATTDANPDTVKIEYSANGAAGPWTTIAASAPDTGSYTWNPVASVDFNTCRIRITATDKVGLTGSDISDSNFTIDSTPPSITAPPDITTEQTSPAGTPVALGTPEVSDTVDPNPSVTNNAPDLFPLGETVVTWTARDASGNTATATQRVTITAPSQPLMDVVPSGSLSFGEVPVGEVKEIPDAYTVKNAGAGKLDVIVSVEPPFHALDGAGLPADPLVFSLAAGQERKVSFDFAPISKGAVAQTITFSSNGGDTARTAKGEGIAPVLPAVTWFAINNGAASTTSPTAALNNTCTGNPTHYMASESAGFTGASWLPYATAPSFTLSAGSGTKTVYFKVKSDLGESTAVSDDIEFNPVVVTVTPAVPTECPKVDTQCPAVATSCPPLPTSCPPANTSCPPVATQCPAAATSCPPLPTSCPPANTTCPPVATQCPALATNCPPLSTKCPPTSTNCPALTTKCPAATTKCPAVTTKCPPITTLCPPISTKCPAAATACPPTTTKCPPITTLCPPVGTKCPAATTVCPPTTTKCPPAATLCPPIATQCPAVTTVCPPATTKCPPITTLCPPISTKCPLASTVCPPTTTKCPPVTTLCPSATTKCPPVTTLCPPISTSCPPEP